MYKDDDIIDSNCKKEHQCQSVAASWYIAGALLEDMQLALQIKMHPDPFTLLLGWLHEKQDVFDYEAANKLPPHCNCDHKIKLKEGTTAPWGPLHNMSLEELKVMRKWLDDNLAKGFIRASSSPAALPALFAQKPGGGLRLCIDYRGLNAITIKNQYAMPLIQETLSQLSNAKHYTKLDIIAAFNIMRIKEGQEWLTAFNTCYGLFETLVMLFGLCNAPATFQAQINDILHPYLDIFCTAYIDNILIYSDDLQSHRGHAHAVLQALREAGLYYNLKKCKFEVTDVVYLGMILSTSGIQIDPKEV